MKEMGGGVKGGEWGVGWAGIDGEGVYQVENGSGLRAYDLATGGELWRLPLGTVQKAPLVLADGKLYVGTESGKFFIVRPFQDHAEILSSVEMPASKDDNAGQSAGLPEPIFAGAAVSRGRGFFVSTGGLYAIRPQTPTPIKGTAVDEAAVKGEGGPAWA